LCFPESKISDFAKLKPAEIKQTKRELFIGTGKGTLEVSELQQEGKKRMSTEEFLIGFNFE